MENVYPDEDFDTISYEISKIERIVEPFLEQLPDIKASVVLSTLTVFLGSMAAHKRPRKSLNNFYSNYQKG